MKYFCMKKYNFLSFIICHREITKKEVASFDKELKRLLPSIRKYDKTGSMLSIFV